MATVANFEEVQERILELRSHICRVISAPQVLIWMYGFISRADVLEIRNLHSRAPEKASFLLIDKIVKCTEPGKWTAFTEALENAEYCYIASLITSSGKDHEQCHHQKRILQIFAPYLELQIEPCEIISQMGASGLINVEDIDEIMACQRNQGAVGATMLLLDRMQRRQAPSKWYMDFLKILYQKGYKDIVKEMEPDFTLDCEVLKTPNIHITDNTASDISTDEHDCVLEEKIQSKVMNLKSEIILILNMKKLAARLCQLLDFEKVCNLIEISSRSQKESIEKMLEEISRLSSRTKWRQFINCLRESDYTHLADILSRPMTGTMQCKESKLVRLFVPTLGQQLDPAELISYLEQESVINHHDKEKVICTLRQSGSVAASVVLLDCMQCRVAPHIWFRAFVAALVNCGREDLAQTIDPDFNKMDSGHSKRTDGESSSYETYYLSTELDDAHSHIYNLEKAAMDELGIIQEHFDAMKSKLKEQIENKTSLLVKTLQDVDKDLRDLRCNAAFFGRNEDNNRLEIEEKLRDVISTNYILRPIKTFMDLKVLGVFQHQRHSFHRQDSFDTPGIVASRYSKNKKHKLFVLRKIEQSVGSSSSSQSSGYLFVERSTSLSSTGSTCDSNVRVNKQNTKFSETEESRTINVNPNKRFKQSVFHAVPEHGELKPLIGTDENDPNSCMISPAVFSTSTSDLPESSSGIGSTNITYTETNKSLRVEREINIDGTVRNLSVCLNRGMSGNISEAKSWPDLRSPCNTMSKSKIFVKSNENQEEGCDHLLPHSCLREVKIHKSTFYNNGHSASDSFTDVSDLLPLPSSGTTDTTTSETAGRTSLDEEINLINYSSVNSVNEDQESISSGSDGTSVSTETYTDNTVSSFLDSRVPDTVEGVSHDLDCSSRTTVQIATAKRNLFERFLCYICIRGKKKKSSEKVFSSSVCF
ncbi:uncharacterized protein LOC123527494 isoform X2 [Mercenaria mercenaria]|uniref:uncharacterized protein LOC123527494 isoform X2 n=1 Tax=Mercenaria mercenaria TaxID=6596 RepID=UPI00234E6796|nr:uncharacterized protein LOC123527494 isoform X2 [Mercenaria mercenaria]